MSVVLRSLDGVKRPMKTFEADQKMFDLLEKVSALRSTAAGRKVYESEVIRDTLLAHAAEDALRQAPKLLKHLLAGAAPEHVEEIRRAYERRLKELLEVCDYHEISVDPKFRPGRNPLQRKEGRDGGQRERL